MFASLDMGNASTTSGAWNAWLKETGGFPPPTPYEVPSIGTPTLGGDSWSTYSEDNNLVYASFLGMPGTVLMVGATDPADIPSETWDYPAQVAVNATSDRPVITFDNYPGATALFAISSPLDGTARVDAFVPCTPGPVGTGTACDRSATTTFTLPRLAYDAAVNDCSGNVLVAYREQATQDIRLLSLHRLTLASLSTPTKGFLVRASQGWSDRQNQLCTPGEHQIRRCNLGQSDCRHSTETDGTCLRVFGGPQIVTTRHTNGNCYAAVGWDYMVKDVEYRNWSRSRVAILNVTNDASPVLIRTQTSNGSTTNPWNDYMTQVLASGNTLGWVWSQDSSGGGNACAVRLAGGVDSNFGITTFTSLGAFPSYTWPAIVFYGFAGMSDYWKGTGRNGKVYPVWGRSVVSSGSGGPCVPCNGSIYNLAAMTAEVTP